MDSPPPVYICPYCGRKSNASVCPSSTCLRLAELDRQWKGAKTAMMQTAIATEANKLRANLRKGKGET